jgi:hypothetical protein
MVTSVVAAATFIRLTAPPFFFCCDPIPSGGGKADLSDSKGSAAGDGLERFLRIAGRTTGIEPSIASLSLSLRGSDGFCRSRRRQKWKVGGSGNG